MSSCLIPTISPARIAVSSAKRLEQLANTPTVAETLPGFLTGSWQGVLAPAGTPPAVVAKLNAEIIKAMKLPEVKEALKTAGADAYPMSPTEFSKWLQQEVNAWGKVIKDNNIKFITRWIVPEHLNYHEQIKKYDDNPNPDELINEIF